MKKKVSILIIFAAVFSLSYQAFGADLIDVYDQALQSDAEYQAARATYLTETENYPSARSALLPNLALTAQDTYFHTNVLNTFSNRFNPTIPTIGVARYSVGQYTLTLSQPLINFVDLTHVRVVLAAIDQAAATYAFELQNLVIRVAQAYFNALFAEDTLRFTQAEKRATGEELYQARERYNAGLDAITSVYNAEARYDSIVAREIADKNQVVNAREELRRITGIYYTTLSQLRGDVPLLTPYPNDIELWVDTATLQNLSLQAANLGALSAKINIEQNFAGHLPTVTAVATYDSITPNQNNFASPSKQQSESVGVQLNLPLYQGGLVASQTRQATFQYERALAEREDTYRRVEVGTRQAFDDVVSGISKVKADEQAIFSNTSSVNSTKAAVLVGTRTIVDLLNAQQNLFEAYRNFARDQYQYLLDTLILKQNAGTLKMDDVMKINQWLTDNPNNTYIAKYEAIAKKDLEKYSVIDNFSTPKDLTKDPTLSPTTPTPTESTKPISKLNKQEASHSASKESSKKTQKLTETKTTKTHSLSHVHNHSTVTKTSKTATETSHHKTSA